MTLDEFRASLGSHRAPDGLSGPLQALWLEARGNWKFSDWDAAHKVVQDLSDTDAAWVHAYLHRREGDLPNARYWYGRAERPPAEVQLEEEWAAISGELLTR